MRTLSFLLAVLWVPSLVLAADPPPKPADATSPDRLTPTKRLVRELPKVSLVKMPLKRVLAHYAKLSGLTIQPDWAGLKGVGITA